MSRAPDPARRSERSRQAILTAAYELLIEMGYAKLTIEAIAARAGVGKQTIYRWWPSKGAVLFDAVLYLSQGDGEPALPDTGDVGADLRQVLRATVEEYLKPEFSEVNRALTSAVQDDPALAEDMLVRLLRPQLEATKERLRSAQRGGELAADLDLPVAVELLYGPIFHRWLLRTEPLTREYADTVTDMALRAIGVGRGDSRKRPAPGTPSVSG